MNVYMQVRRKSVFKKLNWYMSLSRTGSEKDTFKVWCMRPLFSGPEDFFMQGKKVKLSL
jgi:hypothetical protein